MKPRVTHDNGQWTGPREIANGLSHGDNGQWTGPRAAMDNAGRPVPTMDNGQWTMDNGQ